MIAHSELAYVIDPRGYTRYVLDTDPGPATERHQVLLLRHAGQRPRRRPPRRPMTRAPI